MKYDEKKKNYKSRINVISAVDFNSSNDANEYRAGINQLLSKMVDKSEETKVSYLSKPKPPPSWVSESFERYK